MKSSASAIASRKLLLIITGSIAAYKSLELIRRARDAGWSVTPVLTDGAQAFITPLSAAALAENPAYTDLFSLKDETEMGHIRLAREADAVLVAPASADFIAKMAHGQCDDLASTLVVASTAPVLVAPAMNVQMWNHPATQRNMAQLRADGVRVIAPEEGTLACGEQGAGRLAEIPAMLQALEMVPNAQKTLVGLRALITAGPTQEPLDPVRFLSNHSSGKQGYAIAMAMAAAGADVTLISGPTALQPPANVRYVGVRTAQEMMAACEAALPADVYVGVAAVADWHIAQPTTQKIKKKLDGSVPTIKLVPNPDILQTISNHRTHRPGLVVGFAAETHAMESYARGKLHAKGCDWLVATNAAEGRVFGADITDITLMKATTEHDAPILERIGTIPKPVLAARLCTDIAAWWQNGGKKAPRKAAASKATPTKTTARKRAS